MARPLPNRIAAARPRAASLPRVGAGGLLPPLLLAAATLLCLLAAYSLRPDVRVDLGDYSDSAYLAGFNDREIDAVGAGVTTPWPADTNDLTLPGGRRGVTIAQIAPGPAAQGSLDEVALAVNGVRVSIPRRPGGAIFAVIPADIAAAPSLALRLVPPVEGGAQLPVGLAGDVTLSDARTYRWSRDESHVLLPGIGRGDWRVELAFVTMNPSGQPLRARVLANDTPIAALPENSSDRRVELLVPAALMGGGDLDLAITAAPFSPANDSRALGVFVSELRISPAGPRPLLPPPGSLLYALAIALGVYACLTRLTRRPWLSAAVAAALIAGGAWALAASRFPTSLMLPRLALLALWSVALVWLAEPLLRRLFDGGQQTADSRQQTADRSTKNSSDESGQRSVISGQSFVRWLLLIALVSYWVKAGGMLYPYFVGIDVAWHMDRVRWILDGQLPLLYGTNSPLNESTMPQAEWGDIRPVIPYSPWFHIFATSYTLLPLPPVLTAHMVSALLDSTRPILIALLAVRGGLSRRAALLGVLLYAVLPVTYLLHSWGNVPTTFGLWWTLAASTYMVVAWDRLRRPGPFIALTLLLLGALLFYTVAGVFMGLFLVIFTALALLLRSPLRRNLMPLWGAAGVALGVSLLVYYAQYISPILERTVPYFARSLTSSNESIGKASDTLGAYFARHTRLFGYGLVAPLVLSLIYVIGYWRLAIGDSGWRRTSATAQLGSAETPRKTAEPPNLNLQYPISNLQLLPLVVAAWLGVMLLFIPLAYKVSMVDKHFFVAMPFMLVASGAVLDRALRWARERLRGGPAYRLAVGALASYYVYGAGASLLLWLARIATVRQ